MAVTAARLVEPWTRPSSGGSGEYLMATLTNGYFLTLDATLLIVDLYSESSTSTALDTYTGSAGTEFISIRSNATGDCFGMRDATSTTRTLAAITQSGGTLSVTTVGTFTKPSGVNTGDVYLSADASEAVVTASQRTYGLDTSSAAVNFDLDCSTLGHGTMQVRATPAPDHVITYCATHAKFELWEGSTATLLDSLTPPGVTGSSIRPASMGLHRVAVASEVSGGGSITAGILDTSAGTLSWAVGPVTIPTDWPVGVGPIGEAAEAVASFIPQQPDSVYPYDPLSMYLLTSSGAVYRSAASDVVGGGSNDVFGRGALFTSPTRIVTGSSDDDAALWGLWRINPDSYLRQRQSPKRAPSRVSTAAPDLRQRQTPRITG